MEVAEVAAVATPTDGEDVMTVASGVERGESAEEVDLGVGRAGAVLPVQGEERADGEAVVGVLADGPEDGEGGVAPVGDGPEVDAVRGWALALGDFAGVEGRALHGGGGAAGAEGHAEEEKGKCVLHGGMVWGRGDWQVVRTTLVVLSRDSVRHVG